MRTFLRSLRRNVALLVAIVGLVIGIVAIFTQYDISSREQETKALQVVVLASTSLVEVKEGVAEDITVLYKGEAISDLSVVQLKLESTGNQPIRREDYDRPIGIIFAQGAEIVEAEILESSPPNIEMVVEVPSNGATSFHPDHEGQEQDQESEFPNVATLSPTLLNAGDRVIIRFFVINLEITDTAPPFIVDARIAGITDVDVLTAIEERQPESMSSNFLGVLIGTGLGVLAVLAAGFFPSTIAARRPRQLFHDTFDSFVNWETYPPGAQDTISRSTDLKHIGSGSLLKKGADDPHGAYRQIGRRIGLGFVFSGWIYRPSKQVDGPADRLAVEDENFNGYGFAVIHYRNQIWLERRDEGKHRKLAQFPFAPSEDEWYQFKFYVITDGSLELQIHDSSGKALYRTPKDVTDDKYSSFDRVAVHGGSPYHVDELEVRTL